jgi:predicted transport protein
LWHPDKLATLSRSIDTTNYLESIQAAFLIKDSYRRFPRDEEFSQQLKVKDVYNFRNRNYLLRKLENFLRTKELVNVEEYTIEHILPQNENLSNEWQADLGPDWQNIQARYLHTLGNLTLTGYNSEYSDLPFIKKHDFPEKGFRDSPLHLNHDLAKLKHWNADTIVERADALAKQAQQIWRIPSIDDAILEIYKNKLKEPAEDEDRIYTLEHYEYLHGDMLDLFNSIRLRILNLDASVREEHKKFYIAYKNVTNFVDIVPQKSRLRLSLNMPFEEINDPKGLCKDVTGLGRWGNGDVEVGIDDSDQLDDVMFLVRQAFDWQSEE